MRAAQLFLSVGLCLISAAALGLPPKANGEHLSLARKSSPSSFAPEMYADIVAKGLDTTSMNKLHVKAFDGSDYNVSIMGYSVKEDKEVSEGLTKTGTFETFFTHEKCDPWSKWHARGNFLDIGGNIGAYALPVAACVGNKGAVITVEAMPDIANHLRAGIVENKARNVALYPYAVGGPTDPKYVTMTLDPKNKGGSSVVGNKAGDVSMKVEGFKNVSVPLTTLDTLLKQDPRLTAVMSMKVDIEGNEGRFLKGANEFFTKHTPCYLQIELIDEWLTSAGTPLEDILENLKGWGYKGVPSAEYLKKCRWRSKTIMVKHKDLDGCYARVEKAYWGQTRENL